MNLKDDLLDVIYEYISGENYLFYSESMVGKTSAQLDYLIRYLYNNGGNVLILCKNRNVINKLTPIINKYNNPYKLVKYISPDKIYFGESYIKIIHNDDSLLNEIRGRNIDILFMDDINMSFNMDLEDIYKLSGDLYVNNTKIILNGSITRNKRILEKLNMLKTLFNFKEVNNDYLLFIERICKIDKIKKRIE